MPNTRLNKGCFAVAHPDSDLRATIRRALEGHAPGLVCTAVHEAADALALRQIVNGSAPEVVLAAPCTLEGMWPDGKADPPFPLVVIAGEDDPVSLGAWLRAGAGDVVAEAACGSERLKDAVVRALWIWQQVKGRRTAEEKLMRISGRIDPERLLPEQMKPNEAVLYALYDGVTCGVVIQRESDGRFIDCNQAAVRMYGARDKAELLTRHPAELSPANQPSGEPSWQMAEALMAQAYEEGSHQFEWTSRRFDGTEYVSETFLTCIDLGDQRVLMAVFVDITARKRAEEALQKNEEKYRKLVEGLRNEYFFYTHDPDGTLTYVSPSVRQVLGYRPEELEGRSYQDFLTGNPLNHRAETHNQTALEGGTPPVHEAEVMHGDGSVRLIEILEVPVHDANGTVASVEGIIRDVSEQRKAEDRVRQLNAQLEERVRERTRQLESVVGELRREVEERAEVEGQLRESREHLRNLSNYLLSVREEERKRIAREIHDELGQNLTALRLDLSLIGRRLGQDETALHERLQSMNQLVKETILSVQRICSELRPAVLDNLGLTAAIEWLLDDLRARSGIVCRATFSPEEISVGPETGTAVFRVFQEALTNVVRHARARSLDVVMKANDGVLELAVQDDGVGISLEDASDPRSFGIVGMRERVRSIGGTIDIRGVPGKGTRMEVSVPLIQWVQSNRGEER